MQAWQKVWRQGIAPLLTTPGLQALREGLINDDLRLTQGIVVSPATFTSAAERPIRSGCAITYAGWLGVDDIEQVGQAAEYFGNICRKADLQLGDPGACRYFLNWFDDTPRNEMRKSLIAEIDLELFRRVISGDCELEIRSKASIP